MSCVVILAEIWWHAHISMPACITHALLQEVRHSRNSGPHRPQNGPVCVVLHLQQHLGSLRM